MMINIGGDNTTSFLSGIQDGDTQPNAVDLRLGKVFRIGTEEFVIDEEQKVHRNVYEVKVSDDGYFYLYSGQYQVTMENEITVGPDEAGFVITRSTIVRNGCFLSTGLYDSGYSGKMVSVLHVNSGLMKIKPGTRIGQYLNWKSEAFGTYAGDYGKGKEHDKKYG